MRPILILVLLSVCSYTKALYAESLTSPQANNLERYCSPLESDELDYDQRLSHARHIIGTHPTPFFACVNDADCILTTGACDEKISIALVAQKCFEKAAVTYGARVNCAPLNEVNTLIEPACINNTCRLVEIETLPDVTKEPLADIVPE